MFILENSELEVGGVGDIDVTIQAEETIRVKGPVRLSRSWELSRSNGIRGEGGVNILAELLMIKDHGSSEAWSKELGCSEGRSELFLRKDRLEILRID